MRDGDRMKRTDIITGKSAGAGIARLLRPQRELFDAGHVAAPAPRPAVDSFSGAELSLPWPPTVNHYWGQRVVLARADSDSRLRCPCCKAPLRGFVVPHLTERAKRFRESVAAVVAESGLQQTLGRVAVEIAVYKPDNRVRDLDNLGKAPLDALTHAGVWGDDGQIDLLTLRREHVVPRGRCVVKIGQCGSDTNGKA